MAVSRMLRIQILGHASVAEPLKAYLREAGVLEIADASADGAAPLVPEAEGERLARLVEKADGAIQFLDGYAPKPTLREKLSSGPIEVTPAEIEAMERELDVESIASRCQELETSMRRCRDEGVWCRDLARELEAWLPLGVPLERLATARCETQLWSLPESAESVLAPLFEDRPAVHSEIVSRAGGRLRLAVIVPKEDATVLAEALKEVQGARFSTEKLLGTPAEIIRREGERASELDAELERIDGEARALAALLPRLRALSDQYRDRRSLVEIERHMRRTDRVFLLEGWIRAVDRKRVQREIAGRWSAVEVLTRNPVEGEDPPVALENAGPVRPFEFVMTLYGRPLYGEVDPTPLLAPFFLVCFALCLSDAGYGAVLASLSALLLFKLRVRGGTRSLGYLTFAGGLLTVIVGILTGGYFGIETTRLPEALQRLVVLNPLSEPMDMLNVAFLIGIVHILFGMGVKMAINIRAGLWAEAVFDDLCWMLLIASLAPLGFAFILGGNVPAPIVTWAGRTALSVAAVSFVAGIRKERNRFLGVFKSLLRFYSITSYFGDVLSYARLLALGLASAAIALAINGIAQMVVGLPYYTGYVAAILVLIGGHAFNIAVNVLGAFVHSARLQYLEFFNKFFTGGGREFHPFRSERRYTVVKESNG